MPILWLALSAAVSLGGGKAVHAAQPSYDTYKSWLVACDNGLSCEAKGFANDIAESPDMRIDRAAGPDARIRVILTAPFKTELGALILDGKPLALSASDWTVKHDDDSFTTVSTEAPEAVNAFIAATRNGAKLQFSGKSDAAIPLDGMSAALLRMDDRQGRAGGVTALLRKGSMPASRVPPPPSLPAVPKHPITDKLKPDESKTLIAAAERAEADFLKKECEDTGNSTAEKTAFALGADTALVFLPCLMGAYQGSSLVLLVSRSGHGAPVLVRPPLPFLKDDPGAELTEPDFDPASGTLSSVGKGRGLADCGLSASWIWDNARFTLAAAQYQESCGGSSPGDWPTLYRSK